MSLPIAKQRSRSESLLPDTKAVQNAFEVAGNNLEACQYIQEQLIIRFSNERVDSSDFLETVDTIVENVALQQNASDPWSGQESVGSSFHALQQNLANMAASSIASQVQGALKMDYAISDISQLVRGFSIDGQAADEAAIPSLDNLLNAWFAQKNIVTKDGVLFESDSNGEIIKDKAGNPVRESADKVKTLIADREEGLEKYLNTKGIKAEIQEHKFPEEKVQAVPTAETSATEIRAEPAPAIAPAPKADSHSAEPSSSPG